MQRLPPADSPEVLERFHAHLHVVDITAKQMIRALRWHADFDELVSAGREGLWEAARRYDPESSASFKGYAGYRVRGAMIDHLRRMAAVPRRAYERLVAAEAAHLVSQGLAERVLSSDHSSSKGKLTERSSEPTAPPSGGAAEDVVDEHLTSMLMAQAVRLVGEAGQADAEGTQVDPELAYERAEIQAAIRSEVQCLRPAQAEVIRRFYFERQDFGQIAAELNMSKSWVSRTHARALARLSVRLRELDE